MKRWILFSVAIALITPAFAKEAPKASAKDVKAKIEARRAENKAKINAARAAAQAKRAEHRKEMSQLQSMVDEYKKARGGEKEALAKNITEKLSKIREEQLNSQKAEITAVKERIERAEKRLERAQRKDERQEWAEKALKRMEGVKNVQGALDGPSYLSEELEPFFPSRPPLRPTGKKQSKK